MAKYHADLEQYERDIKANMGGQLISVSPFLSYFSCQLFILAGLTEGKNSATESKC